MGSVWETCREPEAREILRYNVGNGFIIPWHRNQQTDQMLDDSVLGNEVFYHWISARDWDEEFVDLHKLELLSKEFPRICRLLIGADVRNAMVANLDCDTSLKRKLQIKQR